MLIGLWWIAADAFVDVFALDEGSVNSDGNDNGGEGPSGGGEGGGGG